jgi:hypothetical protein
MAYLTPKRPEAIFRPFVKFRQAIVKANLSKIHEFSCEYVV